MTCVSTLAGPVVLMSTVPPDIRYLPRCSGSPFAQFCGVLLGYSQDPIECTPFNEKDATANLFLLSDNFP